MPSGPGSRLRHALRLGVGLGLLGLVFPKLSAHPAWMTSAVATMAPSLACWSGAGPICGAWPGRCPPARMSSPCRASASTGRANGWGRA